MGEEEGEKRIYSLPSYPCECHIFFSYKGEVEGGSNKGRGRKEGGRRLEVREVSLPNA